MLYLGLTNFLFLFRYTVVGLSRGRRKSYYFILLILFLFSAFRFQVGCDWSGYYEQYLLAADVDWSFIINRREPIWWAILGWVQEMGFPYPIVNVISSAIFFIGVHILARKQPDPLGFLVLLFPILIVNMPMSAIRQGAAIGLLCIAFAAFIDRRSIMFSLWVILAAGFHASALSFLLLLPVITGCYTKKRLFMAAILAIPGVIFLFGGESGQVARSRYIERDIEAFGAVFRIAVLGLSALYFFLFLRKKWRRFFPEDHNLVIVGVLGMLLVFFLIPVSSVISDRLGYYLIPIQAMVFARIPFLHFKYSRLLHSLLPYLGLLLFFLVWSLTSLHFQKCYIPYNSWLFGFPNSDFY